MVWDVVATEAAKSVTAGVSGVVVAGADGVLRALLRRLGALPKDPVQLRAAILAAGERDPQFAAELSAALAVVAGTAADCGMLPPVPFLDRDALRAGLAQPGVHVIGGAHGMGKTALALQVSQDVAGRFPGGCVYVDLDDFRIGEALQIGDVQATVLRRLGVPTGEFAPALLADQYFRALSHRCCVLVLDNVLSGVELSALAQPWLTSLVLATTRRMTDDLWAWPSASSTMLRGLDPRGAREMLDRRCLGMLAAEEDAARDLLALCDGGPFAIEQVAVRLSRRRGVPGAVATVRDELAAGDDPGELITRCLAQTMRELPDVTVDDLIVLAAQPVEDFSFDAVAATVGRGVERLIDANLVFADGHGRVRLPRLIRDHALRTRRDPPVDADTPFVRLLDFYRDRTVAADLAGGNRLRVYQVPPDLTWNSSWSAPLDWLEAELPAIVAVIPRAFHAGRYVEVTQLCGALERLFTNRGHHWQIAAANEWGIRAAQALGNAALEARIHAVQARLFTQLQLFDRAKAALAEAERLLISVEDPHLESATLEVGARLAETRGDYSAAVDAFGRCLVIDGQHGLVRSEGIHRRMLANVLVRLGRAAEALPLLSTASVLNDRDEPTTEKMRNAARIHTAAAHAHLALGDLALARASMDEARRLTMAATATQYEIEFADLEAELAWRSGDPETARARWSWILERSYEDGLHARYDAYLRKLSLLPPSPR